MHKNQSHSLSSAAHADRIHHLGSAFAAFRRANKPGRRIPLGLRMQVVAALNEGVPAGAIERVCRLSWSQLTRWRSATNAGPTLPAAQMARVLSVVDEAAQLPSPVDAGIEFRVGSWRVSLNRVD